MDLFDLIDDINPTTDIDDISGIRLHKLEIYNWGTFDKYIWSFTPKGNTSLLTGESGSGKSTIVDALTTLLVPPQIITYNKAADASARERTARSYVLGYYGRKYAFEGKGRPEALRKNNSYSTILATFKDAILGDTTTLAIFLWFKDNDNLPSKLYVVSKKELFISKDFTKFDANIGILKRNLKKNGAKIFDSYKNYAEYYRRLMGNISQQAIELFQQTISMKKVEALNDFVRSSMLEKDNIQEQIDKLLKHYNNLTLSYQAVIKAREQIEKLEPISSKGMEYTVKNSERFNLNKARESLELWFASRMTDMITKKIDITQGKYNKIKNDISIEEHHQSKIQNEIMETKIAIAQNGGDQIQRLTWELGREKEELKSKEASLLGYNKYAKLLNLKPARTVEFYNNNLKEIPGLSKRFEQEKSIVQGELVNLGIKIEKARAKKENNDKEIRSLSLRSSNIQRKLIELREELCNSIGVQQDFLPFAGELLEVKEKEIKWEGAIERLVHGFGLSLLVPEEYYHDVASWVNKKSLGTKIVYYRVGKKSTRRVFAQEAKNTVASKLNVKSGTVFTDWITNEIQIRFPHICCEGISEFKKESKAITIRGQIKSNIRHEKDDRSRIDDRTRYILGFSNKKKVEVLTKLSQGFKEEIRGLESLKSRKSKEQDKIQLLINYVSSMEQYNDYNKLDVATTKKSIEDYEKRIDLLETSNHSLETLREQLKQFEIEEVAVKKKLGELYAVQGKLENSLAEYRNREQANLEKLQLETEDDVSMYGFIANNFIHFVGKVQLKFDNADQLEKKYDRGLTRKYDKLNEELSDLKSEIEKDMAGFRREYPSESYEMSENIQSLKEYDDLLERLKYHNLPRYQEDFKQELQNKIIQHISMFNAILLQCREKIIQRIDEINASLHSIDYNIGRYITIVYENTPEADIGLFRNQLKTCTEGMAGGIEDIGVAENKFAQIKEIIERFAGRPQYTDMDKRWTNKVTDVRNWFIFSASERWRDSGKEYEHYSDSDGKSGGQKEKLAYTILAASLAYNYKTNKTGDNSSSFRLVVIDEAFLKSSDESAKFGLKLFEQMNFQLLIVTPLLKISTIEPFISHMGFVAYSDITHKSTLKNIPMEVYKQKRKEWRESSLEKMEHTR